jgi:RNA polymerase sigma factor (sigma-70 family)
MADEPADARLSRINTMWTLVRQANQGGSDSGDAQGQLLERYSGAVYRYLMGAVRDTTVADELFQEFALRFIEGKLHGARADKGRFRDYVKTVLFNLVNTHFKKRNRQPYQADSLVLASASASDEQESLDFSHSWRDELLARTWEALAALEKQTGSLYFTMLDYRSRHPDADSSTMATQLAKDLSKPLTAASVRQTIHRARDKFADLLLEEVSRSLQNESIDAIEEEVIDLGLHSYCADAIKRRREL